MGRQRKKHRRKRIYTPKRVKCGLHLAHLPLPFGTCINLNTFTRILLRINNEDLNDEWQHICRQLNQIDCDMQLFDNLEKCIEYIKQEYVEKLYLLVLKGNEMNMKDIEQNIINACPSGQLTHFYILNGKRARVNGDEMIINGTYDSDDENHIEPSNDTNEVLVPMAIYGLTHGHEISIRDLTNDQVRFVWFQLLLDVLLQLPRNETTMKDMLEIARAHYSSDLIELNKIDEFARDYQLTKAIWWYTNDSFAYRLLNRAFRTQDIRIIFTFRFFILDLYTQLADEAKRVKTSLPKKAFRGQFLSMDELDTIKKNIGSLISTNTFLSATVDSNVAFIYAGNGSRLPSHASVVFEFDLKTNNEDSSFERPFGPIARFSSKKDEKEILFSMGTIFRIISVEQWDTTWFICLEIETQVKECLSKLSAHLRTDRMHPTPNEMTLGDFLVSMGELHQAEQFYAIMLQQQDLSDKNDGITALLYNSIGLLHIDRGDYHAARILFDQAYDIARNNLPLMSSTLNNIGLVDLNQGRYNRALKYFQSAEKYNRSPKRLASILSNIASTYLDKGQLKKARNYIRRALAIEQKHLPPLHFDLGSLYENLAVVEMKMGNYKESFTLLEKSLNIFRETLPSNHHCIATVLNNMGMLQSNMGEFDRALEFCEQALNIQSSSFAPMKDQHLLIAQSLNNLATLHFEKENFSAAEGLFQRALDMKLAIKGLDSNTHPSLAASYNNIAMVQMKQGHFEEALFNFERTLNIELPIGNTIDIAITYNNIGGVYHEQNDFIKAKRYYKKACSNALTVLPRNHPKIELYKNNLTKAREMIRKDKLKSTMDSGDK